MSAIYTNELPQKPSKKPGRQAGFFIARGSAKIRGSPAGPSQGVVRQVAALRTHTEGRHAAAERRAEPSRVGSWDSGAVETRPPESLRLYLSIR